MSEKEQPYLYSLIKLTLCIFALGLISSCSLLKFGPTQIDVQELRILVSPDANGDSPLTVEAVLITDENVLKLLSALPADKWFERRNQISFDYPKGFQSWSWELVPGQEMTLKPPPFMGKSGMAVLLFAHYYFPGEHRARIDSGSVVTVNFQEKSFVVSAQQ